MALEVDEKGKSACPDCGRPMHGSVCANCAFDFIFASNGASSTSASESSEAPGLVPGPFSELPAELSHYVIDRDASGRAIELGRGGMGVTFRGMDTHLQVPVAIKVINARFLSSNAARERFLREARLAARVRHQNIASSLHLGRSGDRWYYVMELAPGETLDALIRREGPLRPSDALEIGRQVALALGEAERMKLVHRDIKPLNLMVDRSHGRLAVKVIDFGLVKSTDADPQDPGLTEAGWVGTVHFASPEQLREKPVDIRSDFYSLGASLWFALRGQAPFEGSRADIIAGHLKGIDLSQAPHPALHWLLAPRPEDRPANAAILEEYLREQLSSSESGARHLSVAASQSPRFRRWALVALLTSVLAVATVWLQNSQWQLPTLAALFPRWIRGNLPLQEGELDLTPDELVERARALYFDYSEGKNDRAIALLVRALQLNPNHLMARATLANAYCQRYLRFEYGREWLDNAAKEVDRLLETHPDSAPAYAAAGLVRYAQGQLKDALRMQRKAVRLDSLDPRNHRNLAITLRERGQLDLALISATTACELDKGTAINWSIRGSILKGLQRDDEAIEAYEQSAHLNLSVPEPVLGLAHIRLLRREWDLALQEVERANRAGHRDLPETCSLQAQIALARGQLAEAEVALRKAVKASPSGNPYHFGGIRYKSLLGYVLLRRGGAAEEANTLLNDALKLDQVEIDAQSENPVFHYSLAATLAGLGRFDAAADRLQRARQLGWRDERTTLLDPRLQRVLSR